MMYSMPVFIIKSFSVEEVSDKDATLVNNNGTGVDNASIHTSREVELLRVKL